MIVVVGLSHKTAPVAVRERLAAGASALPEVLAKLTERKELGESLFLSTCNRVEVFASLPRRGAEAEAFTAIREVLAEYAHMENADGLSSFLYTKHGDEAVRHIFRVAASLDSMVLGEPQILGQVKDAFEAATAKGALRHHLGKTVNRAFSVAKRVRTETSLGEGTVSISSIAVELAQKIFGNLQEQSVLLLGAGEMAEQAAKSLGKSVRQVRVCNRSFDRGAALARELGAGVAPWESLQDELTFADVVIASTGSTSYIVTSEMVKKAMKARKGRTLFFIDISVPRNIEPEVHKIENVFVFNVDDLEAIVAEGLQKRAAEANAAEAIVKQELEAWGAWAKGLDVQPTINAFRTKARATLETELEKTLAGRLKHLSEADRAALHQMLDSAANKLLHAPTARIKERAGTDDGAGLVTALSVLFDLGDQADTNHAGHAHAPHDKSRPHGASEPPLSAHQTKESGPPPH